MPTPNNGESKTDFISRCIPIVIEDGTADNPDQAVAVCNSMWNQAMEGKATVTKSESDGNHPAGHYLVIEDPKKPTTWHLRVKDVNGNLDHRLMGAAWAALHEGYRGNQYEGPNKQEAITKLKRLYAQEKMELPSGKTLDDETLIVYGEPVKALGGGKVGGYLIRFTTDNDPDLEGEFFNKETYFGDAPTAPVYYQHGMDSKMGKRRLGTATHKPDEFGIWAEAQLNLRDEYEKFIYQLAEQNKMGWSSGTASHLVEREVSGKAVWIKSWPLGLDDTLTPVPAEPRNGVLPLKSWEPITVAPSLADRMGWISNETKSLMADVRGLLASIDRPLSETKRVELEELLEQCSGMDAVRSDIQKVLETAPTQKTLVSMRQISYRLEQARRRYSNLLEE